MTNHEPQAQSQTSAGIAGLLITMLCVAIVVGISVLLTVGVYQLADHIIAQWIG